MNTWLSTGNLIGSTTNGQYDTSQIQPGTQITTYAQALALVGSYPVTGISLVVDSGWAFTDKEPTFYTGETTPPSNGGLNPAQACKKLRTDMGAVAFRLKYGTNLNGANAYGKCVSAMARMRNDGARAAAVTRIDAAAAKCAKLTAAKKGKGKAKGLAKHAALAACVKKAAGAACVSRPVLFFHRPGWGPHGPPHAADLASTEETVSPGRSLGFG